MRCSPTEASTCIARDLLHNNAETTEQEQNMVSSQANLSKVKLE
jgi:hypothetical protein